ncbi:MAG TPA: hypothetical protein VFF82_03570 [Rhodocyclaceae bacterium]|nr:hypothetical protein [Rhodocyclaceae bacterium]
MLPTDNQRIGVPARDARDGISSHILPTSATMVGACMTVLSIGRISHAGRLGAFVDKMLAVDAILFLISAALSFVAMRVARQGARVENWAEEVFLLGLTLSAIAAVGIAMAIDQ